MQCGPESYCACRPAELATANAWLIAFAGAHLAAAAGLVGAQGAKGLILADAVGPQLMM